MDPCSYLHEEVNFRLRPDAGLLLPPGQLGHEIVLGADALAPGGEVERLLHRHLADVHIRLEIGRASCRERVLVTV